MSDTCLRSLCDYHPIYAITIQSVCDVWCWHRVSRWKTNLYAMFGTDTGHAAGGSSSTKGLGSG
eukprot:259697-Rhodomonas_salina.2